MPIPGRRVSRGGAQGAWAPPLEIEKQKKKKKKKGHQSKYYAISPIFCYFFSRKYHFLSYFLSWAPPPPEKLKSKKKKKKKKKKKTLSEFGPPPLTNSWTRACLVIKSFVETESYQNKIIDRTFRFTFCMLKCHNSIVEVSTLH